MKRYEELITATSNAYGRGTRFFLACGPMASDYCVEVKAVIASVAASGIKAYLLNQVEFEDGKSSAYGKVCAYVSFLESNVIADEEVVVLAEVQLMLPKNTKNRRKKKVVS